VQNLSWQNIDLSKIKKEHLALLCLVLIIGIIFFAYRNIFQPLQKSMEQVSAKLQKTEIDIKMARISPENLKKLENNVSEINTEISHYVRRLSTHADVPQILKELNGIAERLDIKFVSVKPQKEQGVLLPLGKEVLLQIPINIRLQCGYHQLGVFINQIESSTRFMKITKLKIHTEQRNIWQHQVELDISSYNLVPTEAESAD
jgi:Tfp pilus assembly protein PilO